MKIDEGNIEQAERFLRQEMSKEEYASFAQQMSEDPELSADVEAIRIALFAIEVKGVNELKSKLKSIRQETDTSSRKIKPVRWWAIAASFALLASITWIALEMIQPESPEEMFASNFEAYQAPINVRGSAADSDSLWRRAGKLYEDRKYREAAILFEAIDRDGPTPSYLVDYYTGVSYLASKDPKKASGFLISSMSVNSDYIQQARWYLALSHLSLNEIRDCRKVLYKIVSDPSSFKYAEAKKILAQLPAE